MSRGLEFVRSVLQNVTTKKNFAQCLKSVQILSAGNGKCKAQFVVTDDHVNFIGSLHGGFTSTIIDCVSTYALLTHDEDNTGGVSVDLYVTFLKAAFPGETVTIDAKTIHAGKKVAFLSAELTKDNGKIVVARGQHTKYIGG